ncbi:MAG TPA: DUF167 domain-containing protein [Syntrophomonadaceae bacterium]|nr:DUF167 domain-containing protein [Syntrophomonadaceae bacterium]HQE22567.1 DUF167 domain-containing protein [Syntrophomonadaceae bacterium]
MINLKPVPGGVRLEIVVQPRSAKNQVCGEVEGCLKLKITAPPVDGEANQALIKFLANWLQVSRQDIVILRGESNKRKLIEIRGVSEEWLRSRLESL